MAEKKTDPATGQARMTDEQVQELLARGAIATVYGGRADIRPEELRQVCRELAESRRRAGLLERYAPICPQCKVALLPHEHGDECLCPQCGTGGYMRNRMIETYGMWEGEKGKVAAEVAEEERDRAVIELAEARGESEGLREVVADLAAHDARREDAFSDQEKELAEALREVEALHKQTAGLTEKNANLRRSFSDMAARRGWYEKSPFEWHEEVERLKDVLAQHRECLSALAAEVFAHPNQLEPWDRVVRCAANAEALLKEEEPDGD